MQRHVLLAASSVSMEYNEKILVYSLKVCYYSFSSAACGMTVTNETLIHSASICSRFRTFPSIRKMIAGVVSGYGFFSP